MTLSTDIPKHKTFISFHHEDDYYKNCLESGWAQDLGEFISRSVDDGDINPNLSTNYTRQLIRDKYIADATVTLVLVGPGTWRRKHVDWEISSSIRDTKNNPRNGLLGILLPTYQDGSYGRYNPHTVPPRLYDNIKRGFAKMHLWPSSPNELRAWIHDAYEYRSGSILPNNSRDLFSHNRPESQPYWSD